MDGVDRLRKMNPWMGYTRLLYTHTLLVGFAVFGSFLLPIALAQ